MRLWDNRRYLERETNDQKYFVNCEMLVEASAQGLQGQTGCIVTPLAVQSHRMIHSWTFSCRHHQPTSVSQTRPHCRPAPQNL